MVLGFKLHTAMTETEYIAAGANRHPSVAHWVGLDGYGGGGVCGILVFGSGRNVAVWRAEVRTDVSFSCCVSGIGRFRGLRKSGLDFVCQVSGSACGCACGSKMREGIFFPGDLVVEGLGMITRCVIRLFDCFYSLSWTDLLICL